MLFKHFSPFPENSSLRFIFSETPILRRISFIRYRPHNCTLRRVTHSLLMSCNGFIFTPFYTPRRFSYPPQCLQSLSFLPLTNSNNSLLIQSYSFATGLRFHPPHPQCPWATSPAPAERAPVPDCLYIRSCLLELFTGWSPSVFLSSLSRSEITQCSNFQTPTLPVTSPP